MRNGLSKNHSGTEAGFGEIAIDLREARLWLKSEECKEPAKGVLQCMGQHCGAKALAPGDKHSQEPSLDHDSEHMAAVKPAAKKAVAVSARNTASSTPVLGTTFATVLATSSPIRYPKSPTSGIVTTINPKASPRSLKSAPGVCQQPATNVAKESPPRLNASQIK